MWNNIRYYFYTSFRWLLRCGYCRGFGIQSPSAYAFVRYVINVHNPYYAYEKLEKEMSEKSLGFRKLGRLMFRLANYWQPQYVVMGDYDFASYVYAGCNSTLVRMIDDYYFEYIERPVLVILEIDWLEDENIKNDIFNAGSDKLLLLVIGIYANKQSQQLWANLMADERSGVSYDLYYCGIIFFDKSKYKQHFKINF